MGSRPARLGDLQASERLVGGQLLDGHPEVLGHAVAEWRDAVLTEVLDPDLLGVALPVAGVALVGGHQVGPALHLVRRDRVGQAQATDRPPADRRSTVLVRRVEADDPAVHRAERPEVLDRRGREVDDGDAVGLLDGDVGLAGRRVDGDVLGLEVLRDREVGGAGAGVRPAAVHADARRERRRPRRRGSRRGRRRPGRARPPSPGAPRPRSIPRGRPSSRRPARPRRPRRPWCRRA